MTLEEAIKHCEEKAAELRKEADDCKEIYKEQCEKPRPTGNPSGLDSL